MVQHGPSYRRFLREVNGRLSDENASVVVVNLLLSLSNADHPVADLLTRVTRMHSSLLPIGCVGWFKRRDIKQAGITVGIQSAGTWTIVLITTSSDEAVIALAEAFRLGATEIVRNVGRWWRRAVVERDQGALRVVVAGPHHLEPAAA